MFAVTNTQKCNANSQWAFNSLKVARTPTEAFPLFLLQHSLEDTLFYASSTLPFFLFLNTSRAFKRKGTSLVPLMLLFTEGSPSLLSMYTGLLPVLPPRCASCHQLAESNKAAPSLQRRWATEKCADSSQHAPLWNSGWVSHAARVVIVQEAQTKRHRVNTAIQDVEVYFYQSKMLLVKTHCVWHASDTSLGCKTHFQLSYCSAVPGPVY